MIAATRLFRVIASMGLTVLLMSADAACGGSPPKPQPSSSSFNPRGERTTQLVAALGTCFINHHLIPESVLRDLPKKNGQVDTNGSGFQSWFYFEGDSVTYQNKTMGDWVEETVTDGKVWPTSLCGPIPSPSAAT